MVLAVLLSRTGRAFLLQHLLKANCAGEVGPGLLRTNVAEVVAHKDILRVHLLGEVGTRLLPNDAELLVAVSKSELVELHRQANYLPEEKDLLLQRVVGLPEVALKKAIGLLLI